MQDQTPHSTSLSVFKDFRLTASAGLETRSLSLCGLNPWVWGLAWFSYCCTPKFCPTGFPIDHNMFVNRIAMKGSSYHFHQYFPSFILPRDSTYILFNGKYNKTFNDIILRRGFNEAYFHQNNYLWIVFKNLYLYVDFYDELIKVQMNRRNRSPVTFTRKRVNEFHLVYATKILCPSVLSKERHQQ